MSILKKLIPIIQTNLKEILSLRNTKVLKLDNSYVSEGDLLTQKIIIDFLNMNFESIQIISEETYDGKEVDLTLTTYTAVVDPIDGTENFVSGLKEWGIGISIYKGADHFESMIALPELDQYITSGDSFSRFSSRIYGLSSSLSKEDLLKLETGFEYRIIGCCMYNMLNVIRGSYQQFQNPKGAASWDILPGLNLALENNLEISIENQNYNGKFLQPNRKYSFLIRNI